MSPLKLSISAREEPQEVLRYDYDSIEDEEARNALMGAALNIKTLLRRSVTDNIRIGMYLIEVKNYQPPGGFMAWVETEVMEYRTAKRFMDVAERFGHQVDELGDLVMSAFYLLAKPSTPDEAIEQTKALVAGGQTPNVSEVDHLARNGTASYWSPAATTELRAEPEQPQAEAEKPEMERADPSLTEVEALALIRKASVEFEEHPEIEEYAAGSWSLWLAQNVEQWPPIHSCRLALRKLIKELKAESAERMADYFDAWMHQSGVSGLVEAEQIKALVSALEFQQWLKGRGIIFDVEHAVSFVRNRRETLKRQILRPLDVDETKLAISRYFERIGADSDKQYRVLSEWTYAAAKSVFAPVLQSHLYLEEDAFGIAKAQLLVDYREALGIEDEQPQAVRPATAQDVQYALDYIAETADVLTVDTNWLLNYLNTHLNRKGIVVNTEGLLIKGVRAWRNRVNQANKAQAEQAAANAAYNKTRQTKAQLSEHVRLALGHLPEAREDDFYDLTGTTVYSEARRKLIEALHQLEQTLDAVKEV